MHILLTDVLTCPRCGPDFGLIVLADRITERRVEEGRLGCANCREMYAIRGGVADLRLPGSGESLPGSPGAAGEDTAVRLATLLGVTGGGGMLALVGLEGKLAAGVAEVVPGVEVVSVASSEAPDGGDVSTVRAGSRLPFRSGSMRGVALPGSADEALVREALRIVAPGMRVAVDAAGPGLGELFRESGATVLFEQEDALIATR